MKITLNVEVPEEDLKRYLRAANAALGRDPIGSNFPWDLERFAIYAKNRNHNHEELMGILIREAVEYLSRD